jgi:NIMA-interacting peptidyl-prolyl cis-trans isomerase 1
VVCKSIAFVLLAALATSCSSRPSPTEDLPPTGNLVPDPARMPQAPEAAPEQVSVRHILCAYLGAKNALGKIKLNRDEARIRAEHILKLARAKGQDFAELTKKYSDDATTSLDGGDLGTVGRGQLHPDLEQAAFGLGLGQVSEVVESPRGFHILQRTEPTEFQAAEITITYTGSRESRRYQPRATRTKQEARALAEEIVQRVRGGGSFYDEAMAHSDLTNYSAGGIFPIFKKGAHPKKLQEIVDSLGIGEVSEIVETETGFHIVKRMPVQRIQIRQIMVEYQPPGETEGPSKRTKQEALARAEKVRRLAQEPGSDFAALAAEYSDGPAANRGGLSEPFGRGQRSYDFEDAVFSLQVGEISGIIETKIAVFLVKRIR